MSKKKYNKEEAASLFEELKTTDDSAIDTNELANRNKGSLKKVWSHVQTLYSIARGKNVPLSVKGTAIGALLYVVMPVDAIPDITPMVGLLDDAAVVGMAIYNLQSFLASPLGLSVVSQSKDVLKKTAKKSKELYSDFANSESGKTLMNGIKAFAKDTSVTTKDNFIKQMKEALNNDQLFGYDFFSSKKGETILDIEGNVIIDNVDSEYLDKSIADTFVNNIKSFINEYGKELSAEAINYAFRVVRDLVRKNLITSKA
jgi:uncharacterized membrane protein YkvA (DUF1232 family)